MAVVIGWGAFDHAVGWARFPATSSTNPVAVAGHERMMVVPDRKISSVGVPSEAPATGSSTNPGSRVNPFLTKMSASRSAIVSLIVQTPLLTVFYGFVTNLRPQQLQEIEE
ncbi:MAG: hypothetical protein HY043_17280 [Verrucomicrobia bacterium]|nr:hypothetical protein [Verrucomicrobiota bacterium]